MTTRKSASRRRRPRVKLITRIGKIIGGATVLVPLVIDLIKSVRKP